MDIGIGLGIFFANTKSLPPDIVQTGLMTEYRFDEVAGTQTILDYSGNGSNAQLGSTSGVDINDPTANGQYYQFTTNDYIKTPVTLTFPCTVGFVVSFGNPATEGGSVIGNIGGAHSIKFTAGQHLNFTGSSNYQKGIPVGQFVANQFYHITAVYRAASDLSIYKDGVDVTADSTDYWSGSATAFEIGSRNGASILGSGRFAYLLSYSRALLSSEVARNHSALKTKLTPRGIALQ